MSKASYKHEHIYKATSIKHKLYRCIVDGCPHSISAALLLGREAKCPTCEGKFIVRPEHLRRTHLACIGCGLTIGLKKTEENPLKNVDDFMKKLRDERAAARDSVRED